MRIDDQQWTITRGSFVHKPMVKFSGYIPQTFCCCCCCKYLKLLMVSTKQFTRLLEFIKLYLNKINPFIFLNHLFTNPVLWLESPLHSGLDPFVIFMCHLPAIWYLNFSSFRDKSIYMFEKSKELINYKMAISLFFPLWKPSHIFSYFKMFCFCSLTILKLVRICFFVLAVLFRRLPGRRALSSSSSSSSFISFSTQKLWTKYIKLEINTNIYFNAKIIIAWNIGDLN